MKRNRFAKVEKILLETDEIIERLEKNRIFNVITEKEKRESVKIAKKLAYDDIHKILMED